MTEAGRSGCRLMTGAASGLAIVVTRGAAGGAGGGVKTVASGGGIGVPAGGLLSRPQRKMRVGISRESPPVPCGAELTMVISSPVSTACTW